MAEKTVPWWRRALQFALGGIRSGFGLFQRGGKPGEAEESEPVRGVEAREAELPKGSEGIETAAAAQENAIESPLESEGRNEVEELAEEIPLPVAGARVNEEAASNLLESAPAGEKEEPQQENEAHGAAPLSEPVAELKGEAEGTIDLHPPEPVIEAEMPVPVQMEALEGRVEEAEILEADAEVDKETSTAEPAQVMGEVEAERIETTAAKPNLVVVAAMEEPTNAEWAEELEPVEAEATVVVTGMDAPAEEHVEEVKAVEVRAEEPVASAVRPEPEAAYAEEPAMDEVAPEEVTEPQEEMIAVPVAAAPDVVEETGGEVVVETQDVEAAEEAREESVPVEAAEAEEESSDELVEAAPDVVEEAGGELVVEKQVAEAAEESAAEESSVEAQTEEPEPEEPASMEGPSNPEAGETEAKPEPRANTIPEAESLAEVTAEAVAVPAQLELIPKPQVDEKAAAKLAEQQRRRKEAEAESPFSVMVGQVYDGPLDLLLDLIRKQDIDIYDIPIAKITAQFLAYVNQLKASDVDVAGEFIYTASLLIHIKSKMLLPRTVEGPGEAPEDPRRELVERLLEHERFKNAAQMLQQKQMMEAASWSNPGYREFVDDEGAEPEIAADTVDLVKVFREILERARNRPVLDVAEDTVTVGQMIRFLGRRLMMEDKPIALKKLLSHTRSERALIAMFLALLELVRLQAVLLRQDRQFSEIFVKKHAAFETVMNEGLANARDDWR
jgi:segregation and condensation protein A